MSGTPLPACGTPATLVEVRRFRLLPITPPIIEKALLCLREEHVVLGFRVDGVRGVAIICVSSISLSLTSSSSFSPKEPPKLGRLIDLKCRASFRRLLVVIAEPLQDSLFLDGDDGGESRGKIDPNSSSSSLSLRAIPESKDFKSSSLSSYVVEEEDGHLQQDELLTEKGLISSDFVGVLLFRTYLIFSNSVLNSSLLLLLLCFWCPVFGEDGVVKSNVVSSRDSLVNSKKGTCCSKTLFCCLLDM